MKKLLALALACVSPIATAVTHLYSPADVRTSAEHAARESAQRAASPDIGVFHAFRFTDVQPTSGVKFLHRIVDDAGKHYKAVHYDHGNGVALADVDSDGLIDIYWVSQAGPHALYRNLGGGKFEDITSRAGVAGHGGIGVGASFADLDNDGDADLYVTYVRSPNQLFVNDGSGRFTESAGAAGLDLSEHSSATTFFDYDRDGLLDAFVAVVGEYTSSDVVEVSGTPRAERLEPPVHYHLGYRDAFAGHLHPSRQRVSRLFRNRGDLRFEDVTAEVGLLANGWTGDASVVDFNRDGWSDLYVLNMQGMDSYWINEQGKRFARQADTFSKTPWGAMGVKSFDFDNDGLLDLFVTDMHSDMSEEIERDREKLKATWITRNWTPQFLQHAERSVFGNALFHNLGDGTFAEISNAQNVENYWPWGASVGDLNADGWQDIFITTSMNYPFRYQPNAVLLNGRGRGFHDAEYLLGVEPRREGRVTKPWFELACEGEDRAHTLCKDQRGRVVVHGALGSRAAALADLDNDGDLDIATNEFGDVPQILVSDLAATRGAAMRYLTIELVGSTSNRDALGAVVTVLADRRYVQVNDGKSGYLSQSRLPLYFGLGESTATSVEVRWPSGQVSTHQVSVPSGLVRLAEPGK